MNEGNDIMAFEGMDVDLAETQVRQLNSQAQSLHDLISQIDGTVATLEQAWVGKDATEFSQQWQGQHKVNLNNARQEIENMAVTTQRNITQQQDASNTL